MRRHLPLFAAIAGSLLFLPSPAATAPRTYTIVVDTMKFGSAPQQLRKGDIIVWENHDLFVHNAVASGVFDIDLPAGKAVRLRVTRSGTFAFSCKYHPGMKGVLKVAP